MQKHWLLGALPIAAMTAALIGCSASSSDDDRVTTIAALTADAAAGKAIYGARCEGCHGADGKSGSAGINAVKDAVDNKRDAIEQVIEGGDGMPSFGSMSDQEIANVIAYLASLQ